MAANDRIYYVENDAVDKAKWNQCIDNASNGLIYSYSFYLDAFCKWDAIILNDYQAVMPLPFKKKFGVYYIYQPFLSAQLGLFGSNVSALLLEQFFKAIPKKFSYWHFSLNHQNYLQLAFFPLYKRINYVLDLKRPYEELYKNYRENIKRNIKKADQFKCRVKKDIDVESVIQLAKLQHIAAPAESDYENFRKLYDHLHQQQKGITYGVYSDNNELLASCVFFFSHQRAYYILVGNHPNGRTLGASHLLIDAFIKDHSDRELLLDFEGSDIRNLAFFYSSFGAVEESYAAILYNKLPWYIKWFKK